MQPGEGLKAAAPPSCTEKSGLGHPKEGPPSSGGGGGLGTRGAEQNLQQGISDHWKRPRV